MSHSEEVPFGDRAGRSTNAHETGHGIHSYLRNKYTAELGKRVNGFYGLSGRGIIVQEPNIRKSQVNRFIPSSVRGYRFPLYLERQKEWDDTPLYIYDEWNAYVLGGKCCVDDYQARRYQPTLYAACIDRKSRWSSTLVCNKLLSTKGKT